MVSVCIYVCIVSIYIIFLSRYVYTIYDIYILYILYVYSIEFWFSFMLCYASSFSRHFTISPFHPLFCEFFFVWCVGGVWWGGRTSSKSICTIKLYQDVIPFLSSCSWNFYSPFWLSFCFECLLEYYYPKTNHHS